MPTPPDLAPSPFIVGMARSGTTLLRMMLDAHPSLAIPPETHFIPALTTAWAREPDPHEAFLKLITGDPRWPDFGLDTATFAGRLLELRPPSLAGALDFFYRSYAERFEKARWGDKTPPYVDHMVLISQCYPRARFVHIVRDCRDVALSVKDHPFGPNTFEEAADSWVARINDARRQSTQLPHYLELRYEDLVTDAAAELRRVCDFIELDWQSAMLRYHERAGLRMSDEARALSLPHLGVTVSAEERASIHRRLLGPPDPARIGQWRAAMSADEQRLFTERAGSMLTSLGYDLT